MAKGHAKRKHALLSASGASRWVNCPPSARLEEDFTEGEDSDFAKEGTLAHEFAELGLKLELELLTGAEYEIRAKELRKSEYYSIEMVGEVAKYINFVVEQLNVSKQKTPSASLLIEEIVDLTEFIEEGFGTCDANIIADSTLDITDLKYGKGIKVDADENPQLMLYGLGALRKYDMFYDIQTVRLNIVQPRLDHISTWSISVKDLLDWGENVIKPKAIQAYAGEGVQYSGSWCQWCKAKPRCKALAAKNLELAKLEFADPMLLTDEELLAAYKQQSSLVAWAKSVAEYLLAEANKGKKWPGYKLVEGKSNRKWTDEKKVIDKLFKSYDEEAYLNIKLKGLGDIERLVGKKLFKDTLSMFLIKPTGAPTLVPESDRHPAFGLDQAKEDFKN